MNKPKVLRVAETVANGTLDVLTGVAYLAILGNAIKTGQDAYETVSLAASGFDFSVYGAELSVVVADLTGIAVDMLALRGIGNMRAYLNSGPATHPDQG